MEVGHTDSQLLSTFTHHLALLGGHGMSDFSGVDAVLHHKDLEFANIVHDELLEAGGQHVAGLSVGSITDVGHQVLSLKTATHSVINTLGLTPCRLERKGGGLVIVVCGVELLNRYLDFVISIGLMADKLLRPLLHDLGFMCWSDCHFSANIMRNIR